MAEWTQVLWLTLAAGAAIPAGGLLAHSEHLKRSHLRADLLLGIVAFGGGALMAAAVLVLIPDGLARAPAWVTMPAFVAGSAAFLVASLWLARTGTEAGQLMAMVLDYLPESLALGAALALGHEQGVLLAILIGAQNLPEGFNSYRDLCGSGWSRALVLGVLGGLVAVGPAAGLLGFFVLDRQPVLLAGIVMFAAGGILSLVFHDIAPQAHRSGHVAPAAGFTVGFCVGLFGLVLLG